MGVVLVVARCSRCSAGWGSGSRAPRPIPSASTSPSVSPCRRPHRGHAHGRLARPHAHHRAHPAVHVLRSLEPGHLPGGHRHPDQRRAACAGDSPTAGSRGRSGALRVRFIDRSVPRSSDCSHRRRRDRRPSDAGAGDRHGTAPNSTPDLEPVIVGRGTGRRGHPAPAPGFPVPPAPVRADLPAALVEEPGAARSLRSGARAGLHAVSRGGSARGAGDRWVRLGTRRLVCHAARNPHRHSGAERLSGSRHTVAGRPGPAGVSRARPRPRLT